MYLKCICKFYKHLRAQEVNKNKTFFRIEVLKVTEIHCLVKIILTFYQLHEKYAMKNFKNIYWSQYMYQKYK